MVNSSAVNKMIENVDSKYTLVTAVAKRAREIVDGATPLVENTSPKSITIALEEIEREKVSYQPVNKK